MEEKPRVLSGKEEVEAFMKMCQITNQMVVDDWCADYRTQNFLKPLIDALVKPREE